MEASLLLSWLLVLLRYSTDGDVAFNWGYGKFRDDGLPTSNIMSSISAIDVPLDLNTPLSTGLTVLSSCVQTATKPDGSNVDLDDIHLTIDNTSTQIKDDKAKGDGLPTNSSLFVSFTLEMIDLI
jgi:hypothetical protein